MGGLTGQGKGNFTINSDGKIYYKSKTGKTGSKQISDKTLNTISTLLESITSVKPNTSIDTNNSINLEQIKVQPRLCSSCYVTILTLDLVKIDETKTQFIESWDITTYEEISDVTKQLYEQLIRIVKDELDWNFPINSN